MKTNSFLVGAVMLLAIPALASAAVQIGSFSGNAQHNGPAPGEYVAGNDYKAYTILDTTQEDPWYPFDQATYEYTLFIDTDVFSFTVSGLQQTIDFTVGSFTIYRDALAGGTPATWSDASSFTDGEAILSGSIQNMIGDRIDIFGLPYAVTGVAVFSGGTDIANLSSQCAAGALLNDFINFQIGTPPPTYEEAYDVEWKCPDATGVEESAWGSVKSLYR